MTSPRDAEHIRNAALAVNEGDADTLNELGQRAGGEASGCGDADASERLAGLLADAGAEEEALEAYELAIGQGDGGARIGLARHLSRRGDVDGARTERRVAVGAG